MSLEDTFRRAVEEGALDGDVVKLLLPGGRPLDQEGSLWDYKRGVPIILDRASPEQRDYYKYELSAIIKDVVSFHNAYGGYIIFGVEDKGKDRLKGCDDVLDSEFNNRLEAYTQTNIPCHFQRLPAWMPDGKSVTVGVLYIPRRADDADPVSFKKAGPANPTKQDDRAFQSGQLYCRFRDQCRPANSNSDDWKFLLSQRSLLEAPRPWRRSIVHQLPPRDEYMIKFVGREEVLSPLRVWLMDRKHPLRLVTGIGGLGKTSVAYRLCEEVIELAPADLERVVWLSAKEQTYSAILGEKVPSNRVDFYDTKSLVEAILECLGSFRMQEEEPSIDELLEDLVEALTIYPTLVVVDDVDSLLPDIQREVIGVLQGVAYRTVGGEGSSSRFLFTSRIDQGLPPTCVIKVDGLKPDDFTQFVYTTAECIGVALPEQNLVKALHKASSGSPLFAASILRLIKLGEPPATAIDTWRDRDGEEVRRFAFGREVSRLSIPMAKLLYSVILLKTSNQNELLDVLETTSNILKSWVSGLQSYHLITTMQNSSFETVITVPDELVLTKDVLKEHLGSAAVDIEKSCARARSNSESGGPIVGMAISRVTSLWRQQDWNAALIEAKAALAKRPKNADLLCLLGSAYLNARPPEYSDSDRSFESAWKAKCKRPELMLGWIKAKQGQADWAGVLTITYNSIEAGDLTLDVLNGYLGAVKELLTRAQERQDNLRISELSLSAIKVIRARISRKRLDQPLFNDLVGKQFDFARLHIAASERHWSRQADKIRIFEAMIDLTNLSVCLSDIIRHGVQALQSWWGDVESRQQHDYSALHILSKSLQKLEALEKKLGDMQANHSVLVDHILRARLELGRRGGEYQRTQDVLA